MHTDEPVLLAQLSDLHAGIAGRDRDPIERLTAVVAAVAALDPAPVAVVVTGDLTQNGRPAEYERVRELLAPLRMPVHVLPGNHDDRDALRAALVPAAADAMPGYVQYTARAGRLRLLVCDTVVPGHDGGRMCDERLGWLDAQLAADRSTPTVVAMHHPPLVTGIEAMDAIGLDAATRTALADMLDRAPNVRRVVAGHVHRTMLATCGDRPVFTCPSTDLAIGLDLAPGADLAIHAEPAAFALHLDVAGGMTTHVQPVA
ncbi:MAG TPA: phosphodiesterase [Gaiellales bacterium]